MEVLNELTLGRVLWEMVRKWEIRELAKLLGEMKFEPIVGSFLPKRGYAIGSFEHHEWHALFTKTSCCG